MSGRRILLDACPGERRGVVLVDGRPERLIIERDGEAARPGLGAVHAARVTAVDGALAFLDLGGGLEAAGPSSGLTVGARVKVEVTAEPRRGKAAAVRVLDAASEPPGLLDPGPSLEDRLGAWAPGATLEQGAVAREAADLAEEEVLAVEHPLPGGGSLTIEPTRALVAVDVDLAGRQGARAARSANLAAIGVAARLVRLKALGGLVVIDLVGKGHDGEALAARAKAALAPDQPGAAVGPINRFGLLTLALPWRRTPVAELLLGPDGLSPRSRAQRLARRLQDEGRADPGARLAAVCDPETAAVLKPLAAELGPRFQVRPDESVGRSGGYVTAV